MRGAGDNEGCVIGGRSVSRGHESRIDMEYLFFSAISTIVGALRTYKNAKVERY
jgi:hypothetical protein